MKPLPGILEWYQLYGDKAKHFVVTSVPILAAHHSAEWVFKHFGLWIHSFNIVPSLREGAPNHGAKTKVEYIRNFSKLDIVVEDNPETIRSMKNLGIETVTIPRPWNESKDSLQTTLDGLTHLLEA